MHGRCALRECDRPAPHLIHGAALKDVPEFQRAGTLFAQPYTWQVHPVSNSTSSKIHKILRWQRQYADGQRLRLTLQIIPIARTRTAGA